MLSTLPLEELEKYTQNIYEAIIVIAKRARQINLEQKKLVASDEDNDSPYDDYGEEEFEKKTQDYRNEKFKLPKPTTIALKEFLEGKLQFNYPEKKESSEN